MEGIKRKAEGTLENDASKKTKGGKKWQVPKKSQGQPYQAPISIQPGDAGIWATCDMGHEGKCVMELRDLFNRYAERLYGTTTAETVDTEQNLEENSGEGEVDIEATINNEIRDMKVKGKRPLFQAVKIDVKCVLFFKTRPPIVPEPFVHQIVQDAAESLGIKTSRWVRRLSPMTMMGKATEEGLEKVAKAVLAPHFHQENHTPRKFAIRPTIRNHTTLNRDIVIKQVADAVGKPHTVDLKGYDLLILVEIYKNICGMSVVGHDYDTLKRYNLSEIYSPTSKPNRD